MNAPQTLREAGRVTIDRRHFLKMGAASGLVLGLPFPLSQALAADGTAQLEPTVFVSVSPQDRVTVTIKHHEMGQGTTTGLATLIAEELDVDPAAMQIEYAGFGHAYDNLFMGMQVTGGSTAMANSWTQMREAGAVTRQMLVSAAAQGWNVPEVEIRTENGTLSHSRSGRSARYGEFATAAAALPVPSAVTLKSPEAFTRIGAASTRRVDSRAKSTGTALYTIDVKLDGLLTAVIARPPAVGARLKSYDAKAAKAVKGVTDVVEVPQGVAVVATGMWEAMQGRKALAAQWQMPGAKGLSTEAMLAGYRELASTPGEAVVQSPDTVKGLASATRRIDASFSFPYLPHAPMEPLNCVAWLHDGQLETWTGHQMPTGDHAIAAKTAGIAPEKVTLHTLISGGSFGRRANADADFVAEAVEVAKAIGGRAPVRVQRTREDDMQAQYYRPAYVHKVEIGLTAEGRIGGWQHRIAGQSIIAGTPFTALIENGIDSSSVEGVHPTPYAIPAMSVDLHSTAQPIKPLWWRSVGHTHTAYVMETLMDELAEAAGQDALAYRLALLGEQPRMAGVLKLAAEKAGWGQPLPDGVERGIAAQFSFGTYVAQVAEVEKGKDGLPRVRRVVVAVDCGTPINPDQIAAQMEGGVGFALAAVLYGELDIAEGVIQQTNFDKFRVLRIDAMPTVEAHIVPSTGAPSGVGEPGVPPLAPAVANAWYRLTGDRVRRLPFSRAGQSTA